MEQYDNKKADPEMVAFMKHSYRTILRNAAQGTGRNVEPLIKYLDSTDFFYSECGSHDNFPGGTSQHCMDAYLKAHQATARQGYHYPEVYAEEYHNWKEMPELSIAIVCLLHDVCDIRHPHMDDQYFHMHGRKSVYVIEKLAGFRLTKQERNAIKHHMHKSEWKVARAVDYSQHRIAHTLGNPLWQMIRACDICSCILPTCRHEELRQRVEQFLAERNWE